MSNCQNIGIGNIRFDINGNIVFDTDENKKKFPNPKKQKIILNGIDGCMCAKCKSFIPYAEPNMEDGTMVCYSCRSSGGV